MNCKSCNNYGYYFVSRGDDSPRKDYNRPCLCHCEHSKNKRIKLAFKNFPEAIKKGYRNITIITKGNSSL